MENRERWLTDKFIMIMLLVFPLWTGFRGYSDITKAKYLFFVIAALAWLSLLLLCMLADRPRLKRPDVGRLAALGFILACLLSAIFSDYGAAVLLGASRYDGLLTLVLYAMIFLGVSRFAEPRRKYVWALAVSTALCCGVAVLQLMNYNALWLFPYDLGYYDSGVKYTGAFLGTIGNTNVLAAFLCLAAPLLAALAVMSDHRADRLLLLPAALAVYVLLRSGVASGAVGLLCAGLFAAPVLAYCRTRSRRVLGWILAAEGELIIAGLVAVYFWPGESGTVWEFSQVMRGNIDDSFGSSRIMIWREALSLVPEHPLLGGGPDTFTLRTDLGFSRFVEETGAMLAVHVDNAHNEFLNYLVNLGVLGLVPYLALCCASVVSGIRRGRPEIACALVCYFAQSFFGLGLCLVVPLAWLFMGLCFGGDEHGSE